MAACRTHLTRIACGLFLFAASTACSSERNFYSPEEGTEIRSEAEAVRVFKQWSRSASVPPEWENSAVARSAEPADAGWWSVDFAFEPAKGFPGFGTTSRALVSPGGHVSPAYQRATGYMLADLLRSEATPLSWETMVERMIRADVTHLHGIGTEVRLIEGTQDIPDYDQSPMPEDLEALVRPSWQYVGRHGKTYHVYYAWSALGGRVLRYEFWEFEGVPVPQVHGSQLIATQVGRWVSLH